MKEHCDSIGRSVHVVNLGEQAAPLGIFGTLARGWGRQGGAGKDRLLTYALTCAENLTGASWDQAFVSACPAPPRPPPACAADPAAEAFRYPVSMDVRDLITLDDAMQELGLGPNGWVCGASLGSFRGGGGRDCYTGLVDSCASFAAWGVSGRSQGFAALGRDSPASAHACGRVGRALAAWGARQRVRR